MKFTSLLLPLVGAPSLASAVSKGLLRGRNPATAAAPADLSRHLTWTNPTNGAHHGGEEENATTGSSCTVSAEIASPCNMWAFVNGQSLDATMGVSNGASHSSLALSGSTSSVTLVLKSFCTAFSFPTAIVGGNPVPQPMVGATFDVCGTSIPTDDTWVCINHFPDEGSWSSPSFDDSAWPPAVTVEGHGLPPGLTYIAGSPESSDDGSRGWETFCRKTVPLPGNTGGDAAAPSAPPAPVVPATPALPLLPPVWITRVLVEGNCSLVDADLHDLSVNFGFLLGLKEEFGFPPCNCTLLSHHAAPALTTPTDSARPCTQVTDPCLFNYSFSGPQDWLTAEMLEKVIHEPTFSTIFDTRNSSSSEFCEVQEEVINVPPAIPETGEEPPLITDDPLPLPLRPNTSTPANPPTPAVPGGGSNDSSVSESAPPAPVSRPDVPSPSQPMASSDPGIEPAPASEDSGPPAIPAPQPVSGDSSVTGPSPPAPASPPSVPVVPAGGGDNSADSSVTGPSQTVASNDPGMEPAPAAPASPPSVPVVPAGGGDNSADSSVTGPSQPVASNDPGMEPPETLANGGDPDIPDPQPAASNDEGGDIAVGPAVGNEEPGDSNDDGGYGRSHLGPGKN